MKGGLKLRPVYHYRGDRIRAHVQLCWLALLLIRVIETAACDTWRNIRHELDRMHLVTLATADGQVAQRSVATPGQQAILHPSTCENRRSSSTSRCHRCPDQRPFGTSACSNTTLLRHVHVSAAQKPNSADRLLMIFGSPDRPESGKPLCYHTRLAWRCRGCESWIPSRCRRGAGPWAARHGRSAGFLACLRRSRCLYEHCSVAVRAPGRENARGHVHIADSVRAKLAVRITARFADPRPFRPVTQAPDCSPDWYMPCIRSAVLPPSCPRQCGGLVLLAPRRPGQAAGSAHAIPSRLPRWW